MKTNVALYVSAFLALTSCGSAARYSYSERYNDGIYYKPETDQIILASKADDEKVNGLVHETRNSEIFLSKGVSDTLFIPEDKSATSSRWLLSMTG